MPFKIGHSLASRNVSFSRANNLTPKTIFIETVRKLYAEMRVGFAEDFEKLTESFPMDAQEFRETLDPEHIVAQRAGEGGSQAASLDVLFQANADLRTVSSRRSSIAAELKLH